MLLAVCRGGGRPLDLPFRPATIRVCIHLFSVLCQTFVDDALGNRHDGLHEIREAFVLG